MVAWMTDLQLLQGQLVQVILFEAARRPLHLLGVHVSPLPCVEVVLACGDKHEKPSCLGACVTPSRVGLASMLPAPDPNLNEKDCTMRTTAAGTRQQHYPPTSHQCPCLRCSLWKESLSTSRSTCGHHTTLRMLSVHIRLEDIMPMMAYDSL